VTRTFSKDKHETLKVINGLEPSALYDQLRTSLPHQGTRQYLVRVTGYRKQFVDTTPAPTGANP